ncbi:MAG TPA: SAM-dependent methyltransferase [Bdellovibrionales bacterium]|nr:SAM-dependent methyltransferase [Bdellovibrionales bacterium]
MEHVAYLAPDGFEDDLAKELGDRLEKRYGRLMLARARPSPPVAWTANTWLEPKLIEFESASDGARKLRSLQRNWAYYPHANHRRAELIQDKLPHVSAKPIEFLGRLPTAPLGSWTLLEPNVMLASAVCTSLFPNGEVQFHESPLAPSRAYLKLWELFTVHGVRPQPGDRVLDLGSSPGGWTWVLAQLGCQVLSVDKAPLAPEVAALPNVESLKKDAFTLAPESAGPVDWLFSDIICYPERLLELVETWRASGLARNFACTIKFQGPTDMKTVARFQAIPGSRVLHLHHNKHELTWINETVESRERNE